MSRSGYSDDCDGWKLIMWRGAVASAIRGKRGQAFFREMLAALDALPEKKLITDELEADGAYCALGVVGEKRGVEMENLDPYDRYGVASAFDIAPALAAEIMFMNDDGFWAKTPEQRFEKMRQWVAEQIVPEKGSSQ
jgi:hypothetical protein